jgi:hypothetical protein
VPAWTDGVNGYLHILDATVTPPRQVKSIPTSAHPYWIIVDIDGTFVLSIVGRCDRCLTKQVAGGLKDEIARQAESEKLLEVLFVSGQPVCAVDQLGVGQVRGSAALQTVSRSNQAN